VSISSGHALKRFLAACFVERQVALAQPELVLMVAARGDRRPKVEGLEVVR
jgi:hypothetical protein